MTELEEIFYGLELHSLKWNNYFDVYEKHLGKFKNKNPSVLEVGVKYGGGIELLHKYFDGGKFYGIDCWVDSTEIDFAKYGIDCTMFLGDQGSNNWWKNWIKENPNLEFDIIIDDGSHQADHQWMTLLYTFSKLKDGGLYIIEDTHTSFTYSSNFFKIYLNRIIEHTHEKFIKNRITYLSQLNSLYSYTIYNSQIVLEKRSTKNIEMVFSDNEDRNFNSNRTIWNTIDVTLENNNQWQF